jgi:hypothetical protein
MREDIGRFNWSALGDLLTGRRAPPPARPSRRVRKLAFGLLVVGSGAGAWASSLRPDLAPIRDPVRGVRTLSVEVGRQRGFDLRFTLSVLGPDPFADLRASNHFVERLPQAQGLVLVDGDRPIAEDVADVALDLLPSTSPVWVHGERSLWADVLPFRPNAERIPSAVTPGKAFGAIKENMLRWVFHAGIA